DSATGSGAVTATTGGTGSGRVSRNGLSRTGRGAPPSDESPPKDFIPVARSSVVTCPLAICYLPLVVDVRLQPFEQLGGEGREVLRSPPLLRALVLEYGFVHTGSRLRLRVDADLGVEQAAGDLLSERCLDLPADPLVVGVEREDDSEGVELRCELL